MLVVVLGAGCDDERGDPAGPSQGPLNGDVLFGSALVTSEILRGFNALTEEALNVAEGSGSLPITIGACQGNGTATITDNNDAHPATFAVTFSNYVIDCEDFALTLNTDDLLDAKLVLTFLETSPGLRYLLELPFDGFTPRGVSVQLPSEEGGIILALTTPLGPLSCELEGERVLRHEGGVHFEGTLRYEDRAAPLLIVMVLDLEYEFDDGLLPKFSEWPAGSYEVAGFGGGGGFGFGGGTSGTPVDVFFDGLGGAAFPVGTRSCVANLETQVNPCEDLE
jgi:hypothetical protein